MFDSELIKTLRGADIIDEASDTVTYLGYFDRAVTATDEANCVICKVEKAGNVTTFKWANGQDTIKNQIWDNRAGLTYKYKV